MEMKYRLISENKTIKKEHIHISRGTYIYMNKSTNNTKTNKHSPVSGADNCICQKNRSNYDTSNRFGTNTL